MEHLFIENIEIDVKVVKNIYGVNLISKNLGMINRGKIVRIPIWLACIYFKYNFCEFRLPKWLNRNFLLEIVKKEKSEQNLCIIPTNYLEVGYFFKTKIMYNSKPFQLIFFLLDELNLIRMKKILFGTKKIGIRVKALKIDSICTLEILTFKHLILTLLKKSFFLINLID